MSTVIAALQVGENGKIVVYEGANDWASRAQETVEMNNPPAEINICHGIVGNSANLRGEAAGANQIGPEDIPLSDVLVLDCEERELKIIGDLGDTPSYYYREVS
ncbi:hypothetical protein [Salarchaeum japonicum]|uniref:hypothetical protein n=1 Tax=Salarchaeum japonicum TaxID=555573 RepID=UPI001D09A516|nr:hypothetical protein [Salarchaeum japonicum]